MLDSLSSWLFTYYFFSYFKVRHFCLGLLCTVILMIDLKVTEHHRVGFNQTAIAFRYETLATTRKDRIWMKISFCLLGVEEKKQQMMENSPHFYVWIKKTTFIWSGKNQVYLRQIKRDGSSRPTYSSVIFGVMLKWRPF